MNKLEARFINPEVIEEIKNKEKSFVKLDISLQNQKDGIHLGTGILTKRKVKQHLKLLTNTLMEPLPFLQKTTNIV